MELSRSVTRVVRLHTHLTIQLQEAVVVGRLGQNGGILSRLWLRVHVSLVSTNIADQPIISSNENRQRGVVG
jgi:hypothetical protein